MVEDTSDHKFYSFGMVSFALTLNTCSNVSISYSAFAHFNPEIMKWINTQMKS